ncbi:polysaccharide deacetylase family protein [Streptomyces cinerochromogenes]|uniref:polysaccharide deacetylase family protein n=1 Tax=Streptomyces cinerochromogenes TaxID=66422 RepID=UPI0033BADA7E
MAVAGVTVGGCGAGGGDGGGGGGGPSRSPGSTRPHLTPGTAPGTGSPAWRAWGLTPLPPAPDPPADKPVRLSATGAVPVVTRVPVAQRVVFITVDDGHEKDPRFVRILRDLRVPISMFLTDDAIRSDYGYFRQLQALGNRVQNHTLHHPVLTGLTPARQKEEVCGAQKVLTEQYGTAPLLFRPPYGAYDGTTRAAVAECGPRAIVGWRASMQIHGLRYQDAGRRLRPGDIILAHFRGPAELKGTTMTQMFANLLRHVQQQGFAVARLENYVRPPLPVGVGVGGMPDGTGTGGPGTQRDP